MTGQQAQLVRLVLICAAWAGGETLLRGIGLGPGDAIIPALLALGVYAATAELGRSQPGGGDAKYWRGRRIDDGRRGGRLN